MSVLDTAGANRSDRTRPFAKWWNRTIHHIRKAHRRSWQQLHIPSSDSHRTERSVLKPVQELKMAEGPAFMCGTGPSLEGVSWENTHGCMRYTRGVSRFEHISTESRA
jgi:hypothetical protein